MRHRCDNEAAAPLSRSRPRLAFRRDEISSLGADQSNAIHLAGRRRCRQSSRAGPLGHSARSHRPPGRSQNRRRRPNQNIDARLRRPARCIGRHRWPAGRLSRISIGLSGRRLRVFAWRRLPQVAPLASASPTRHTQTHKISCSMDNSLRPELANCAAAHALEIGCP
jgi:hypothetical protein